MYLISWKNYAIVIPNSLLSFWWHQTGRFVLQMSLWNAPKRTIIKNPTKRDRVAQYSYLRGLFNGPRTKCVREEWLTKPIVYCALPTTILRAPSLQPPVRDVSVLGFIHYKAIITFAWINSSAYVPIEYFAERKESYFMCWESELDAL